MKKIDVLVVDDSALMRKMVSDILSSHPMINAKDTAINGKIALNKIKKDDYDVILLDIEMPEMDGIQFLEEYSKVGKNIPIIILSSFAKREAEVTIKALSLGAKDFITKPSGPISMDINKVRNEIIEKVLVWGIRSSPRFGESSKDLITVDSSLNVVKEERIVFENPSIYDVVTRKKILPRFVAIGVSTGGPPAIRKLLLELSDGFPLGIVIVQHMPEFFTAEFAKSLSQILPNFSVVEARDFETISKGKVIIAKGGKHLIVNSSGGECFVRVIDDDRYIFRPSVDLLFESIASSVGKDAIGIIMTGMGSDGARGLKKFHDVGGITIAQDEKSSTIFGMPKSAIKAGAVDFVWSLDEMAGNLKKIVSLLI
ncbi:MAG: chemotaxis response regulator protein-glutamate methylesterase [Brevinematia bacterium]